DNDALKFGTIWNDSERLDRVKRLERLERCEWKLKIENGKLNFSDIPYFQFSNLNSEVDNDVLKFGTLWDSWAVK
ncbi:MAG: hypothetical protein ACKVRN_05660, partial [Pyrinomonadaceae bacterium]